MANRKTSHLYEVREVEGLRSLVEHKRLFKHAAVERVEDILRDSAPRPAALFNVAEGLVSRAEEHGSARFPLDQEAERSILVIRGEV